MSQITIPKRNGGDLHQPARAERRTMEPYSLMRDLLRWDPFREIAPTWPREALRFDPTFEVKETKDSFIFKADLPGVREQDLQMTVTGTRLTVSGKREEEKEDRADTYHTYERSYESSAVASPYLMTSILNIWWQN